MVVGGALLCDMGSDSDSGWFVGGGHERDEDNSLLLLFWLDLMRCVGVCKYYSRGKGDRERAK